MLDGHVSLGCDSSEYSAELSRIASDYDESTEQRRLWVDGRDLKRKWTAGLVNSEEWKHFGRENGYQ